ncbi:FERM domain-containing protein 4A-like isoform X2 [Portunus trituberculatus]|uniref:FERM domain-containing protein 4A-like isoform X2 n=1 Tax=Portunus trituberculatus TaxID=210409 RepID=UPI001E1D1FFC|nr:FERM domain-containing protein 4A-like isoform X2 [Portunus trituberculatus]
MFIIRNVARWLRKLPRRGRTSLDETAMGAGVRVEVVLLDARRLEVHVGPRLLTHELLAMVASHFTLREHQYFSLAHLDSTGHYQWLTHERRVVDHECVRTHTGPAPLTLYFLVKYYVESILQLQGSQTVELFYQQARSLVYKGHLEAESDTAFRLAALALQATYGDFSQESATRSHLKKAQLLPTSVIREHPSLQYCEERVSEEHRRLQGYTRGHAILQYMSLVERLPTYGTHYYEVRDRSNLPWYLGLSHRGIAQYDFLDKKKPRRVFLWKQLENLYFRERKFSIEVHDPKRVVHTLSSFNLYEDAIEDSRDPHHDDLLAAITEATTQVSVSRRTFGPGNVSVYVWFAETQSLCKAIWSMAIAQHQFYLDRKTSRSEASGVRELPELAVELSRSCVSLSTHSSSSNLSRSGSQSSLVNNSLAEDSASTESLHQARMEMYSALKERRDALQEKIKEKEEELRLLCLREGELTGELPPEYPVTPGQPPPTVRKRVGTSFALSENLISKIINKQEETVAALELEYEIQGKITSAALRLANETSARKGVRKQRKMSYQQSVQRLKDLETKLKAARSKQAATAASMPKQKKKPRPVSDSEGVGGYDDSANLSTVTVTSSQECPQDSICEPHRDVLSGEGVSLSPATPTHPPVSPRSPQLPSTPVRARARRDLSPGGHSIGSGGVHSAPTSPHKQTNGTVCSRPASPNRPNSGYIPSSVYTRSQYRSQQYPTLSTRSQSVPADEGRIPHPRIATLNGPAYTGVDPALTETPGGLYNIPQQRTSLACHSVDDLDTSTLITHTHPHPNHHHPYRQRNDSQDRYGSLDRRWSNSGRLESRSMEHLESVPSPATAPSNHHSVSPHIHPTHTASYSHHPHYHNHHFHTPEHSEAMDTTSDSHPTTANCSFDTMSSERSGGTDVVDGVGSSYRHQGSSQNYRHRNKSGPGLPAPPSQHHRGQGHGAVQRSQSGTVHVLVRTASGRSYMETTFMSEPNQNQENIPPYRMASELQPLRSTNGKHHESLPPLHSSSSSSSIDHHSVRQAPTDITPLRVTKPSDIPPLRATSSKAEPPNSHNVSMNTSMSSMTEEPLISLAEAARMKKERGKEWYETSLDSPASGRRLKKMINNADINESCQINGNVSSSQLNLNVSGSSVGSTGSSNSSIFQSRSDSADTSHASVPYESPQNHMIISAGTYQPSREVTKPFEMSDFYKYSTKYRRQSSSNLVGINGSSTTSGSVSSVSSGGDTPLSPVLPPRTQMMVSNSKLLPPSPNMVAHHSAPAPQQKGVYQPLTPLTCQPVEVMKGSPAPGEPQDPVGGSWETAPLHQAVPATVTHKRSATLV